MTRRATGVLLVAIGITFGGLGCGESPVSPTDIAAFGSEGPSITVLPTHLAVAPGAPVRPSDEPAMRVPLSAVTSDPITITVLQVPSISTTINPGETATITGLAPGSYTLVFTQNGTVIGTQSITGVQPGEQIQITVVFEGGSFVMVVVIIGTPPPPPPAPCTIDGRSVGASLVIEGQVVSGSGDAFRMDRNGNHARDLFDVDASGASYRCVGQAGTNCKANLQGGAQVHVRGTLLGCTADAVVITASEVKVQKP